MTAQRKTNPLLWSSRIALIISVIALLCIRPLCYCPGYYVALSAAGIIPLLCGPRLYRWFGAIYMFAALLFAAYEHRAALRHTAEIQHIRAEAHAQHP
jgi:hypothetical protein